MFIIGMNCITSILNIEMTNYERQESLQNIADSDFNVEVNNYERRELATCGVLFI